MRQPPIAKKAKKEKTKKNVEVSSSASDGDGEITADSDEETLWRLRPPEDEHGAASHVDLELRAPPPSCSPILARISRMGRQIQADGRRSPASERGDEMEGVVLLDSYDEEMGLPPPGASGAEAEEAAAESHVRVTGMMCSTCTSVVEAPVSVHRRVRRVAVLLLQNHTHVMLDTAIITKRQMF